ncbi:MAG: site-specific integrase [Candidatus Thiodiazotropha sp. (ex Troendleina suluensis)]|nr:site-specific integrase [Candidatus Thiodiazotropha sp. (ex Troendleina suluensis)]
MALSDSWLKANSGKKRDAIQEVKDRDGLSVRVSPLGKIVFQMRYRYDRKLQRLDIGSYPKLKLKAAREENHRLKKELEQGHNPKIVRKLEKQALINADTLESIFRQWYESYCKKNKKMHHEICRSFELYVLPVAGDLPAEKITLHQWLAILEEHADKRPAIAERILTNSKQMLKWAAKRQLIPFNVLTEINAKEDLQIKKVAGDRSLSDEEIKLVWLAINESRMAAKNKLYLKLCLVLACRNGELRLSRKEHFDLNAMVWTVPPENHKLGKSSNKPLLRPIIPAVKELVEEAIELSGEGDYLFNNSGTNEPMGQSAPLQLPYNIMQWLRRHKDYEMKHWSVHDLRKTARTNLSSLTEPHIAEIMLGHRLPGSWQVYDHYDYLPEQEKAYAAWWERLMDLVS